MKTIGIKLADGTFYPILEEGEPKSRALDVTTVKDNQTKVQIDLYRSETNSMVDAEYVDTLEVTNLNPHPNGEPDLHLSVSIDENNELKAEVIDAETGEKSEVQVQLVSRTLAEREASDIDFSLPETAIASSELAALEAEQAEAESKADDGTVAESGADTGSSLDGISLDLPPLDDFDMPATDAAEETTTSDAGATDDFAFISGEPVPDTAEDKSLGDISLDLPDFDDTEFGTDSTEEKTAAEEDSSDGTAALAAAGAVAAGAVAAAVLASDKTETSETAATDDFSMDLPDFGNDDLTADTTVADETTTSEAATTDDFSMDLPDFGSDDLTADTTVTDETTTSETTTTDTTVSDDFFNDLPDFDDNEFAATADTTKTAEATAESNSLDEMDFSLPDFGDSTDDSATNGIADDQIFEDDAFAATKTATTTAAAGSAMDFSDLYDDETLAGEHSTPYGNAEVEEVKKKTRVPVIICVVCAIICIIATLLVLFVIPSKYNLIKSRNTKNGNDVEWIKPKAEVSVTEEPLPPPAKVEKEPEPIPVEEPEQNVPSVVETAAQEDKIVVAPKPDIVPVPAEKPKVKKDVRYRIKWGDTLWDISDSYYKNPWKYPKIARYNHIKNPDLIISGTDILIPEE